MASWCSRWGIHSEKFQTCEQYKDTNNRKTSSETWIHILLYIALKPEKNVCLNTETELRDSCWLKKNPLDGASSVKISWLCSIVLVLVFYLQWFFIFECYKDQHKKLLAVKYTVKLGKSSTYTSGYDNVAMKRTSGFKLHERFKGVWQSLGDAEHPERYSTPIHDPHIN